MTGDQVADNLLADGPDDVLNGLSSILAQNGLIVRGGFLWSGDNDPHGAALSVKLQSSDGTLVLIGNAGSAMWQHFASARGPGTDAMNDWTRAVIDPIAQGFGAQALYPFDVPHWPFQQWALRAEHLSSSPLGLLIHPHYGLWHAYRAALLFDQKLDLPDLPQAPSPCDTCLEKPCLTSCPVSAFDGVAYDVPACSAHLHSNTAGPCMSGGCLARMACPVGRDWHYAPEQIAFHMKAFARAVAS